MGDSQPGPGAPPHSTPEILILSTHHLLHVPPTTSPSLLPFIFISFFLFFFCVRHPVGLGQRRRGRPRGNNLSVCTAPGQLGSSPLSLPALFVPGPTISPCPSPHPFVADPTPPPWSPSLCVVSYVCKGPHCTPLCLQSLQEANLSTLPLSWGSVPSAPPVTTGLLPQVPLAPALSWALHIRVEAGLVQWAFLLLPATEN